MKAEDDFTDINDGEDIPNIPLANNNGTSRAGFSSSEESRRSMKRKVSFEEEEYMKRDPELYGLRRSVSSSIDLGIPMLTKRQGSFTPKSSSGRPSLVVIES